MLRGRVVVVVSTNVATFSPSSFFMRIVLSADTCSQAVSVGGKGHILVLLTGAHIISRSTASSDTSTRSSPVRRQEANH